MQQILAPKSPGLPFSEWNPTPLSTSSTLICSTDSSLLSEKGNDSLSLVCHWVGTVFICGPVSSARESVYYHWNVCFFKLWSVCHVTLDRWARWERGNSIWDHHTLTLRRMGNYRRSWSPFEWSEGEEWRCKLKLSHLKSSNPTIPIYQIH